MYHVARFAAAALIAFLLPLQTFAWGANAERLIANRAVETLPPDLRPFFEANRDFITRHAADPVENLEKNPATEGHNQVLYLDRYGHYPFDALPRKYAAAMAKFGRPKLESGGLLPWQIGVYSAKLTEAMRSGNWEQARLMAAQLAGYVAQAFDPFNTTENYDGRAWDQPGVKLRFDTSLVDRYSLFFPLRPNDAALIRDPTDHAFEDCLQAHSWLEIVLVADRHARSGLSDYTDEYYDRFYSEAGATLIRQLSDAAADVGSYWLTSWINAGRPALPRQ
ncbi:MAG TPA: hypothetical protein VEL77_03100 [Rugosimonospora sp.]|nr:hypothetical protein [Rugosimonospora sp.]